MELQQLIRAVLAGLLVGGISGCGDNYPRPCAATDLVPRDPQCLAATMFAARDTADLVPVQEEIDRYYDRWTRVGEAEPFLYGYGPQTYQLNGPGFLDPLYTTNPVIIAAWLPALAQTRDPQPAPISGDPDFDDLLADFEKPTLYSGSERDGVYSFIVTANIVVNETVLVQRLLQTDSYLQDPFQKPDSDGQWSWLDATGTGNDEATAVIDYRRGWGDCFVGCIGFRDLRAIVPPTGPATVYDLGGDPLPPNLNLSPNTKPPPN